MTEVGIEEPGRTTFESARFGELSVDSLALIQPLFGLPRFEHRQKYGPVAFEEEQPFLCLPSVEEKRNGFVLIDPMLLWPNYDPTINQKDLEGLEVSRVDDLAAYCMGYPQFRCAASIGQSQRAHMH